MADHQKHEISFIHTSAAAITPLMQFYGTEASELEVTNLLDDGVMRYFASSDECSAEARFAELLGTAVDRYHAELAMLTCSSISKGMMARLRQRSAIPLLKIDEPMARLATEKGGRLGVVVTFQPTIEPTRRILLEAAAEQRTTIDLVFEVLPEAYSALLSGDIEAHDELLLGGVGRLCNQKINAVVLAQVSMARVRPRLKKELSLPVFSSLDTSLVAIRELLDKQI